MARDHNNGSDADPLTPKQARVRMGVSERTFERYVAEGRIKPAFRLPSGHARYSPADIDALLVTQVAEQ